MAKKDEKNLLDEDQKKIVELAKAEKPVTESVKTKEPKGSNKVLDTDAFTEVQYASGRKVKTMKGPQ